MSDTQAPSCPALLCSDEPLPVVENAASPASCVTRASTTSTHSTAPPTSASLASQRPAGVCARVAAAAGPPEASDPSGNVMNPIVADAPCAPGVAASLGVQPLLQHDGAVFLRLDDATLLEVLHHAADHLARGADHLGHVLP